MTFTKLSKIIFTILLLVTLGELTYYGYTQIVKTPQLDKSVQTEATISPPALPIGESTPILPYTPPEQAYKENYLNSLRKQKADILISSIVTHKYKGKIIKLDTKGGINPFNKFEYAVVIEIQGEKGSRIGFLYNERDLQIANLIKSSNGKEETISINDLKIGDDVIITEVKDAFMPICSNDECLNELTIEKLF